MNCIHAILFKYYMGSQSVHLTPQLMIAFPIGYLSICYGQFKFFNPSNSLSMAQLFPSVKLVINFQLKLFLSL